MGFIHIYIVIKIKCRMKNVYMWWIDSQKFLFCLESAQHHCGVKRKVSLCESFTFQHSDETFLQLPIHVQKIDWIWHRHRQEFFYETINNYFWTHILEMDYVKCQNIVIYDGAFFAHWMGPAIIWMIPIWENLCHHLYEYCLLNILMVRTLFQIKCSLWKAKVLS